MNYLWDTMFSLTKSSTKSVKIEKILIKVTHYIINLQEWVRKTTFVARKKNLTKVASKYSNDCVFQLMDSGPITNHVLFS